MQFSSRPYLLERSTKLVNVVSETFACKYIVRVLMMLQQEPSRGVKYTPFQATTYKPINHVRLEISQLFCKY